ncbi:type II secretion system F family protein [Nonomuraea soli]|uniref:Flp pilus assembly protein TadB n=1 Tax=Nonomuraea soli TaxID=1032476 RepID=A0A7W0HPY5_9ACTN|nr:type II secretion system F family protein [Nonomuraea soli]MBA2891369.1 Flp pilus assembly protein TadB [Nonomuraea soli]
MSLLIATISAALATWFWLTPKTPADRLAALRPAKSPAADAPPKLPSAARKSWLPALAAGALAALAAGGWPAAPVGLATAIAVAAILRRRDSPETEQTRRRITTDLPFAADLMVACLRAGQPVSAATSTAATTVGGPLGERLTWVSTQLRLGADPEPTWHHFGSDPSTRQLARAMIRAAHSGAPVADVLTRVADEARSTSRAASVARARRVGVTAVAPLGLCFLPAFVLLGIIPVIAGLAQGIVLP